MDTVILVITFADESGKASRLSIAHARKDLTAPEVKNAAATIIESGVFRAKGKYIEAIKGQLVKTDRQVLFSK